jgi:hypothetical protein
MKNFYKTPRAELAVDAFAMANAIANGKITGLSPAQNAELAAALSAYAEDLEASDGKAVEDKAASIASNQVADAAKESVAKKMSAIKFIMRGLGASQTEYAALGFTPPAETRRTITPQTPSGLAAYGKDGKALLQFIGNNAPGSVNYLIYEWDNLTACWVLLGVTTKQSFTHENVPPGEYHLYMVRARASNGTLSADSNRAPVYAKR